MRLSDLQSKELQRLLGYSCKSAGGLAINAAGAATYKTVNTIAYLSDGVFKSKAATAAVAFTAGHKKQPDGWTIFYVVGLDAAGNFSTTQGRPFRAATDPSTGLTRFQGGTLLTPGVTGADPILDINTEFRLHNSVFIPVVADGITPVGIIKIATAAAAFIPGTTLLDAGTVTATYIDIGYVPGYSTL